MNNPVKFGKSVHLCNHALESCLPTLWTQQVSLLTGLQAQRRDRLPGGPAVAPPEREAPNKVPFGMGWGVFPAGASTDWLLVLLLRPWSCILGEKTTCVLKKDNRKVRKSERPQERGICLRRTWLKPVLVLPGQSW